MAEDNRLLPVTTPPTAESRLPVREANSPNIYANSYGTGSYGDAEQNYLREYLRVVYKRKWIILSIAIIVTTATALYMFRIPSVYLSEATMVIENRNPSLVQSQQDKVTINLGDDPTYWNTQLKLLQNPELMRQVARELGLQNNPEFARDQAGPGLLPTLKGLFGNSKPAPTKPNTLPVITDGKLTESDGTEKLTPEQEARIDSYAGVIAGGLGVEPIEGTNLVTIKFTHTNPEMAMRVANTVANVFIANDRNLVSSGSTKRQGDLDKSIADLQDTIKSLEDQRIAYQQNHNLPLREEKGQDLKAARLQQLSQQVLTAESERNRLQAAYDAARNSKDMYSIPEVQTDKAVMSGQQRITELEEKRQQLLVKYTEDWPEVKATTKQLEQARKSRDDAAHSVLGGLKARYDASVTNYAQLQAAYAQENNAANQQGIDETGLSDIEQKLATNKQLYNTLIQEQRTFQISSNTDSDNIRVATKAQLPAAPIGPNRSRNIVIALLVSLLAGVGLSFLLDYVDDSLKNTDDITRYLNLPTLALIPYMRGERAFLRARNASRAEPDNSTALTLLEDVRSPVAEAYRHLRTSLLFSSAGKPPKTILITSGQPMEGKTTTAVNTALSLAQTGAEVVIVDCDLRRPRIHHYLEMENIYGVTNYLSGARDLPSLIQTYERLPNLKVIACGPIAPNPAELLGSNEMRQMLELLKENFTHIIIDSPPILSFTDAAVLSTLADGVMVVALSGKSSRALVRRVKQRLADVGARIYGIVLNGMKPDSLDYGYGYYTDRYSRYYRVDDELPEEKAV